MNPQMSPQEALVLLDGAVAHLALNRQDHARLVIAVQVLKAAIDPPPADTLTPDTTVPPTTVP